MVRISWYEDSWIITPAHININDLKNAWVIIWKKASDEDKIEIENIIIAICLSVDRAMIFFKSCSQLADILEYIAVLEEIIININKIIGWLYEVIRIIKKIPAVTRVEEWTRAEIGVGADIAIGNQAENGNCALFVHLAIISIMRVIKLYLLFKLNSHVDWYIKIPIDNKMKISPIRFVNRVIDPDLDEEWFW